MLLLLIFSLALGGNGYYLPGVSPLSYRKGQPLKVKVNSMSSLKTHIPYDHYYLHYCSNEGASYSADYDNVGEILYGDIVKPSLYRVNMLEDVKCAVVCAPHTINGRQKRRFNRFINDRYRGHLLLDNLPVYVDHPTVHNQHVTVGYPLGIPDGRNLPHLNNHLEFTVRYHRPVLKPGQKHTFAEKAEAFFGATTPDERDVGRIVGFTVTPYSIDMAASDCNNDFTSSAHSQHFYLDPANETQSVMWTYSVKFVEDKDTTWYSRWDVYVRSQEKDNRRWVAVLNGTVVLVILTGLVATIIMRTLHLEFNSYNDPENPDEQHEEAAWKLVHGDVFREPARPELFSVFIGTGCQLIGMFVITLVCALQGLVSPASRGTILTALLLLFAFMGVTGGYVTARLSKMFHRQRWLTIFLTGTMFPGQVFAVFLLVNLAMWGEGAANAVPFFSLLSLMGLWFLVSVPLVLVGGVLGYRQPPIEPPCDINPVARWVPPQQPYLRSAFTTPIIGLLPFGAACVEISFLLSSVWLGAYYRVFGFLALIAIIVAVICAESSISLVYFLLIHENHRWWWRSFLCCASAGGYLFLYSLYYFFTRLQVTHVWSAMLYLGYMGLVSYAFAIVCGTLGFLSALWFVRKIYSGIKSA